MFLQAIAPYRRPIPASLLLQTYVPQRTSSRRRTTAVDFNKWGVRIWLIQPWNADLEAVKHKPLALVPMVEPQQDNIFVRAFADVPVLLGDQASRCHANTLSVLTQRHLHHGSFCWRLDMLPYPPLMCAADGIPKAVQCCAQAPRHAQWHTRGAHYRHPAPLGAPGGAFWSFICLVSCSQPKYHAKPSRVLRTEPFDEHGMHGSARSGRLVFTR